ncbi:farnesyl pyrophosphate synthase [Cyclospora cayetanensis]|uniref:Farnesyl pyrophosphate synthase n=1 Tax=Cyclospora cayetanensis TaxID=88456 RepID=A0A6P6RZU5_9EIME|nr:farnesyl pyrophosphate synthase [Cyclospora cayetanensis]
MLEPVKEALLKKITECAKESEADATSLMQYYANVINYNCVGGKLLRGLLTVYASLAASHELQFSESSESKIGAAAQQPADRASAATAASKAAGDVCLESAFSSSVCVLGWGVELLQAAFLVADDQMDGAETRRGKPCWFRLPAVGPANAINDSFFLAYALNQVLKDFMGNHSAFGACSQLIQDVAFKTVLGQHLDTNGQVHLLTAQQHQHQGQQGQQQQALLCVLQEGGPAAEKALQQLAAATRSRQQAAARLKTSYYSFWLPTALGLLHSGVTDASLLSKTEEVCLCIGDYFQAQDDFLDCFGSPKTLGKAGSDIREGKCSWPFAQAIAAATPKEAAALLEVYGQAEGEDRVRELYMHLGVHTRFKEYEHKSREYILRRVEGLEHRGLQSFFAALLQLLYRRLY